LIWRWRQTLYPTSHTDGDSGELTARVAQLTMRARGHNAEEPAISVFFAVRVGRCTILDFRLSNQTARAIRFRRRRTRDQRPIEERNDVLVYTTPAFTEDIEVTGPVTLDLFASTSAKDTDFTAELVDLWPKGSHRI
jgi:X-Pro dipeptidyl-peptidase C-terminal non-catalytic domain